MAEQGMRATLRLVNDLDGASGLYFEASAHPQAYDEWPRRLPEDLTDARWPRLSGD